jgi:hypothetical protein
MALNESIIWRESNCFANTFSAFSESFSVLNQAASGPECVNMANYKKLQQPLSALVGLQLTHEILAFNVVLHRLSARLNDCMHEAGNLFLASAPAEFSSHKSQPQRASFDVQLNVVLITHRAF